MYPEEVFDYIVVVFFQSQSGNMGFINEITLENIQFLNVTARFCVKSRNECLFEGWPFPLLSVE